MNGIHRVTGKALSGSAHLLQSVSDILTTPVGTRVLLRDYGSELPRLTDSPQDAVLSTRIIRATVGALYRWEPRLLISRVQVHFPALSVAELTITGRHTATGEPVVLEGIKIR
ncbi:GPW/gp25 family protein [Enterobacter roggenkampii]|uniref:GPW/gp25 family protein n=1 Tax=Enterobacter roggenkampii TaxID=1812935 RepID=UPI002237922E|nr:GPW/gp25 family protein [Enterobacter roggenkampii]MCW5003535.1 GPW/gp25 family protein [Enterobacter roggenkampii]